MKRMIALVPLVVFAIACSSGQPTTRPGPPPLDPVGTFDCYFDVEGMGIDAVLTITGEADAYEGSISSEMGTMQVTEIVIDGQAMSFVIDSPEMTVFVAVVFEGADFSGEFDAGGQGGFVTGKRR